MLHVRTQSPVQAEKMRVFLASLCCLLAAVAVAQRELSVVGSWSIAQLCLLGCCMQSSASATLWTPPFAVWYVLFPTLPSLFACMLTCVFMHFGFQPFPNNFYLRQNTQGTHFILDYMVSRLPLSSPPAFFLFFFLSFFLSVLLYFHAQASTVSPSLPRPSLPLISAPPLTPPLVAGTSSMASRASVPSVCRDIMTQALVCGL